MNLNQFVDVAVETVLLAIIDDGFCFSRADSRQGFVKSQASARLISNFLWCFGGICFWNVELQTIRITINRIPPAALINELTVSLLENR